MIALNSTPNSPECEGMFFHQEQGSEGLPRCLAAQGLSVILRHRPVPGDDFFRQPLDLPGVGGCQVVLFAGVLGNIIEFRSATVVIAQELPFPVPYRQVRQPLVTVIILSIRRASEKEGFASRGFGLSENRIQQLLSIVMNGVRRFDPGQSEQGFEEWTAVATQRGESQFDFRGYAARRTYPRTDPAGAS